ncbi:uncharacterized protein AMSG_01686 [Thecamonas trahens ATCC 50062]|uniref:Uncharacterized protein n=1 Tax=Thecamonas trahens ATCC 50062 TaxID=461836 RepID=A0A0L0DR90_THETB|nr:hypothetical protein AMSG_01686 [Thecamonas trahens ATCC 50062]KNC54834.1 hypothetical protein AMSG_01686 [Thecamonas trahens ATCC 50062]|eukprot:XP_013761731.1 hypothetical protein AMSG_01686 [Thecamonas trahens ATCC 50062]
MAMYEIGSGAPRDLVTRDRLQSQRASSHYADPVTVRGAHDGEPNNAEHVKPHRAVLEYDEGHTTLAGLSRVAVASVDEVENVLTLGYMNVSLDRETLSPEAHLVVVLSLDRGGSATFVVVAGVGGHESPTARAAFAEARHLAMYAGSLASPDGSGRTPGIDYRSHWLTKALMPSWAAGAVSAVVCLNGDRRRTPLEFFAAQLAVNVGAVARAYAVLDELEPSLPPTPQLSSADAAKAKAAHTRALLAEQEGIIAALRAQVRALQVEKRGPHAMVYATHGEVPAVSETATGTLRTALLQAKREKMQVLVTHRERVDELARELDAARLAASDGENEASRALIAERERRFKAERTIVQLEDELRERATQIDSLTHKLARLQQRTDERIASLQGTIRSHKAAALEKLRAAEARYDEQRGQVEELGTQVARLMKVASKARAQRDEDTQVDDLLDRLVPLISEQAAHLGSLEERVGALVGSGNAESYPSFVAGVDVDLDITPPIRSPER